MAAAPATAVAAPAPATPGGSSAGEVLSNPDLLRLVFGFLGLVEGCSPGTPIGDALALGATHRAARDVVRETALGLEDGPGEEFTEPRVSFAFRAYRHGVERWFLGDPYLGHPDPFAGHPDRLDRRYLAAVDLYGPAVTVLLVNLLADRGIENCRRHAIGKYYLAQLERVLAGRREVARVVRDCVLSGSEACVHERAFVYNNYVEVALGGGMRGLAPGCERSIRRLVEHHRHRRGELGLAKWKLQPCSHCGGFECSGVDLAALPPGAIAHMAFQAMLHREGAALPGGVLADLLHRDFGPDGGGEITVGVLAPGGGAGGHGAASGGAGGDSESDDDMPDLVVDNPGVAQ